MNRYNGTIKTKAQALALARKLHQTGGSDAIAAANYIEQSPERFLSRPEIQPQAIALSWTESCDCERKGSVMNGLLKN